METPYAHLAVSVLTLCACTQPAPELAAIPIACRVEGMSPEDRAREALLLREHLGRFVEVRERAGGYSYRYPHDPALFLRRRSWSRSSIAAARS